MKRKIKFLITVGSYYPDTRDTVDKIVFPTGGEPEIRLIEFEVDSPKNAMDDAFRELSEDMGSTPYHIWYWWWLE